MQRLLKFLHVVGGAGFIGSVAMGMAASLTANTSDAGSVVANCRMVARGTAWVTIPSLLLLVVAGLLCVALRPGYLDKRWFWAKAILGMGVGGIAFVVVSPAMQRSLSLAVEAAADETMRPVVDAALGTVTLWNAVNIALALAATALGVWRPRLGGSDAA